MTNVGMIVMKWTCEEIDKAIGYAIGTFGESIEEMLMDRATADIIYQEIDICDCCGRYWHIDNLDEHSLCHCCEGEYDVY